MVGVRVTRQRTLLAVSEAMLRDGIVFATTHAG
jgi:hypothetical protein